VTKPAPLTLCGMELPWVKSANHLGHELHETGQMEHDANMKRAAFISRSVEIRENFDFASPVEVLRAMKIYCSSFYGCMLWDLRGEGAVKVYNSWTTAIKLTWGVPRATRTYLVQKVLAAGLTSARVDILARYANFFRSLRVSPCHEVSVLANIAGRDVRTNTGSNLKLLEELTGLNPWVFGSARITEELMKEETVLTPVEDGWRLSYLASLLAKRQQLDYLGEEEAAKEITGLVDSLCVS
jgi:hypothetical protein